MSPLIGVCAASIRMGAAAPATLALGLLAVMVAIQTAVPGTAQAADTVRVEVWVWQHAVNAGDVRVGARPADGSWPAPEMIALPLDDGASSSGRYRYRDIAIGVEWRIGAAPVTVEVRIWQHLGHERALWISARGSLGSWRTLGTVTLALADATGSSAYSTGGVVIEAPVPARETGASLRYRFDPAGEATEPGSYAFLTAPVAQEITTYEGLREDAASVVIEVDEHGEETWTFYTAPRASVITTYEGLRRDAATLRVNAAAADGTSSEGLFGAVEAGHLIEWYWRYDCFVRYRVTSVAEAGDDANYREFGVRPETYVWQGCQSGSLPADRTTVAFSAAREMPLQHLGGNVRALCELVHVLAGDGSHDSSDAATPAPPAPTVITVVPGERGVVTLEWTGGPKDARCWQYRLRAAGSEQWSPWTDIPDADALARSHGISGFRDGSLWLFQLRGVVGTLAGEPSESVEGRVPMFDANGIPRLDAGWGYAPQLSEGGRAWRLDATVVEIPAGMRISAFTDFPLVDPRPPFDESGIVDVESDSTLKLVPRFGAECARFLRHSPSGRDVGALFDRIVTSAQVQIDARPWVTVAATGERGEVSLRWFGGPHGATRWEYRLRGPYPCQAGSGCDGSQRSELPWGEWTEIPGSDATPGSHPVSGLPDLAAWDVQLRAVVGDIAGVEAERFATAALVGPDGIPQLHGSMPYTGQGGRTWRLGDSPTVIDVPAGLDLSVSSDYQPDGMFGVSDAVTGTWILVNAETAQEVEFEYGIVAVDPPCGLPGEGRPALFDKMRASIRLQPIAP